MLHAYVYIIGILSSCQLGLSQLAVEPYEISAAEGEEVQFVCGDATNETKSFYVTWTVAVGNVTAAIPTSGRVSAVNGTLLITNITQGDATTYMCDDDADSETQTGVLIVYVMPDYVEEIAIVAGLSLAMLILLVAAMSLSYARQRKQRKWTAAQNKKRRLRNISISIN